MIGFCRPCVEQVKITQQNHTAKSITNVCSTPGFAAASAPAGTGSYFGHHSGMVFAASVLVGKSAAQPFHGTDWLSGAKPAPNSRRVSEE